MQMYWTCTYRWKMDSASYLDYWRITFYVFEYEFKWRVWWV